MNFKLTAISTFALAAISIVNPALAQEITNSQYQAGEFTITLGSDDSYQGCDHRNRCIKLYGSQSVRDDGYRGKLWFNGEYTDAVSWRDGGGKNMRLNILKGDRRIFSSELVPIEKVELKWLIECNVTGIQTGQLAVRISPGGKSRAGLNNGNQVRVIREQANWAYVEVERGPNSQVTGLQGWVNSNYLRCTKEPID
ncbi:SH3 domain-containing protein [Iningainema tapete]|uniref:SH3 domain-containing protein n=1 Tax=Iningainema tapete BLCC-T55 TaxID=2748662 RepID=A0A8J6XLJ3_9CYAN|nr:SH3 domain-containing protein [Iningainema tapete]MBD2773869.1 SH3 domain-containing protein [Iningainema tapete BLCC-T55]